ncbi:MAG TPA: hypothetical protein VKT80_06890, partial [Chloroflexota bacterium]|nr:hypothetical protein [Chloroflexota bacterium]
LPASTKCPNMNSAVTTAVQSTGLGNSVTLQSGSPSEGYYCVNSSGVLTWVSNASSPPNNCSSVGSSSTVPADYVIVQTTYNYTPIFPGLSVAAVFPATITSTSYVRLG